MAKLVGGNQVAQSEVAVRPVRDGMARAQWDRLMDVHHVSGFRCRVGGGLRHGAQDAHGQWLALVGWAPGSFKGKVRDEWVGWAPEPQFRRLHLLANDPLRRANPRSGRKALLNDPNPLLLRPTPPNRSSNSLCSSV